jgi:WD40 repeat protein
VTLKHQIELIDGKAWCAHLLRDFALIAALFSQLDAGYAQQSAPELPTEPILRIEAGQHGAQINSIDTDAANKFAVTASDDKTVRVWSLPDGQLQRIIRLPINDGDIGKAYAVAISPDGGTIAVGGWMGTDDHENIYLFDRASGALKQHLSDLPDATNHLAYSADGQRLAASLASNGIRVFDALHGYRLLPSDTRYGDESDWAQFDRGGRLVTTSSDGFVRLYAADRYATPVARFQWKGRSPYAAAFSPDGTRIAVGDDNSHDVVVLSGSDLTQLFKTDSTGIPHDENISSVAWSRDGRFLYAGGEWSVNNLLQVRRWSDGGRGAHIDISAPSPTDGATIWDFVALKSGSILFGASNSFGLIDIDAKVIQLQGYGALGLNTASGHLLRVSADGGVVQVDSLQPRHSYRFALAERVVKIDPSSDDSLTAPITHTPRLNITIDSERPAVNGTPIKLDSYETARSVAIVPGTQRFVLGAEWSLRLLDQLGHNVWPNPQAVPGVVWHVNVTGNRRLIVAAYDDGTIRWHRLADGKELLALFIHPDGQRWIAWTPQGYYDASLGADELIGWHVNHGYDRAPDFYPVSQFRDRFYRPDVIQRVLQTPSLDVAEAVRDADNAAGRASTRAVPLNSLLTPVVEINDPKNPAAADRTDLQLGYSVRLPSPDDSLRVEALVDGVKVPAEDRPLVSSGATRAGNLHLTIPRRNSTVSVIAYNQNGAGVPAKVQVEWRGPGTDPKLTLYVLAIGVSDYQDQKVQLHFAAKDAGDFEALAKSQEGGLYEKVITHSLRDSKATREAVLDELDWIKKAVSNTNDVAMIFLAGHGVTTPDQHYRFLPYDYDANRVERTTISDGELQDYLTKIGGKKIFFFDTCYSGALLSGRATSTQPDVDKFANQLKAAENGIVVFTSSTGNELSQEKDEWNNGAFTKAVVEGLRGAAARPQNPVIMISDLNGYVSQRVRDLTGGNQKPMMAMPKTVEDYPISMRLQ